MLVRKCFMQYSNFEFATLDGNPATETITVSVRVPVGQFTNVRSKRTLEVSRMDVQAV